MKFGKVSLIEAPDAVLTPLGQRSEERDGVAMGFYNDKIVPRLVTCACGTKPILKQREKVVPLAAGRVLEIGVGAGHNLPFTMLRASTPF